MTTQNPTSVTVWTVDGEVHGICFCGLLFFSDLATQYQALETCFISTGFINANGFLGPADTALTGSGSKPMHVGGSAIHTGQVAQVPPCLEGPCYILFLRNVWVSKTNKTAETPETISRHLGPQQYLEANLGRTFWLQMCPTSKLAWRRLNKPTN